LIVGGYSSWETGGDGKSDYRFILQNMRKTFSEAKSKAPSIIFIDEIDSFIARGKAAHNEGYWRPIVNALLEQISGAVDREGVVVIAATNLRDEIDPALKRAGRLDRELRMQLPDEELLARILRAHLPGVDGLERAAAAAVGGSGADCEKWARGARRTARLEGRPVELGDLLAEIGERTETRPPAALRRAAYHEAGHALHTLLVAPGCLVRVTVRRTIGLNGSTMSTMPLDREQLPSDLDELMQHMLSGRAAEEVVFRIAGAGSGGGPDSDLARATLIAACAEASWGLGESLRWRGDPTAETLTSFLAVNKEIAQAVETRLAAALADARAFLRRNRRALDALADALIERETLTGAEAEAIVSSVTERPSLDLVRPGCV
jgi:ATP-dependent Zn protease